MSMVDNVYADADGKRVTLADKGVTWASDETIASWGWVLKDKDYQAPISADEVKQKKLVALAEEYNEDVDAIKNKILTALANEGASSTKITAAQSEFSTRKAKYLSERAAIINA